MNIEICRKLRNNYGIGFRLMLRFSLVLGLGVVFRVSDKIYGQRMPTAPLCVFYGLSCAALVTIKLSSTVFAVTSVQTGWRSPTFPWRFR